MDSIQWLPKYNTGDETIDSQHRQIVAILQKLQASNTTCLDPAETELLFDRLEEYARIHFSYEEELLEKIQFPYIKSHIKDHDYFRSTVIKWRNDEEIDCKSEKVAQFLTEWLFEHILNFDMRMKEHMNSLTTPAGSGQIS